MIPEPRVKRYKETNEEYIKYLEEFNESMSKNIDITGFFLMVISVIFVILIWWYAK